MAVITARTGNRTFSVATDWVGDVGPVDNTDSAVIPAACNMLMDQDQSAWTGLLGVTVEGHAATPGLLYFKDGTSGYPKVKTGYNIVGTTVGGVRGRILANLDGVWRDQVVTVDPSTDVFTATGFTPVDNQLLVFYPDDTTTVIPLPLNPVKKYYVRDASGDTFKVALTVGGTAVDITTAGSGTLYVDKCLPYANKAIIDLQGTAAVTGTNLEIKYCCQNPNTLGVRVYGSKIDLIASSSTIDVVNNTIDLGTTPPSAGTAIMITTAAGTLPGGFEEEFIYYVRAVSGNTCKLATQNADANIVDITSIGSGTITLFTGHTNTATATLNVLDDVTGEAEWVTTAGHNRVVLADRGPEDYDQQRCTLVTIAAGTITLSENVNSVQYPGARIWLSSRNVSTRSAGASSSQTIYNYSSTAIGGVFGCEIINTSGTGTTFYGYGISGSLKSRVLGTITGCNYGWSNCTSCLNYGTIMGCTYGWSSCTSCLNYGTITGCYSDWINTTSCLNYGTITGCNYGWANCTSCLNYGTITGGTYGWSSCASCLNYGTIMGCTYGWSSCTSCLNYGTITGCNYGWLRSLGTNYATVKNNLYDFSFSQSFTLNAINKGTAIISNPPTFLSRNVTSIPNGDQGVYCENYGGVAGAHRSFLQFGDIIKNTSTLCPGGATSSIEVIPQTNCGLQYLVKIFEITELAVPATAQTRSFKFKGEGWSTWPTTAELYVEATYISNGTTFVTATVTTTAVLTDNTTWTEFALPSFTPGMVADVTYKAYLKKYSSACKVYCDAKMYCQGRPNIEMIWKDGQVSLSPRNSIMINSGARGGFQ